MAVFSHFLAIFRKFFWPLLVVKSGQKVAIWPEKVGKNKFAQKFSNLWPFLEKQKWPGLAYYASLNYPK